MPQITQATAQGMSTQLTQALATLNSLGRNIQYLKQHRAPDKLQQTQSEAIIQLYEAVKQIQDALWPLPGLLIPDVGAVRDAAQSGATSGVKASSASGSAALKAISANPAALKRPR